MENKLKIEHLKLINNNVDLDEYIKFRDIVKQNMEHPDWLGDFSKEELKNMISEDSEIWIFYLDRDPVCSMMFIHSTQKSINKFELELNYKEVIDYGPMMVNPKYVGNQLQYQMLTLAANYCKNNNYKYAISTVHPDNTYCIKNMLKDDFKLVSTKEFKRGTRNIYLKKF